MKPLILLFRPMCLTQHLNWRTIGVPSPKMWKMSFLTVIAFGGYISRWHYIEPYIAILSSPTPYRGPVIAARHLYQWMTSCSNRLEAVIVSKHITVATYISLLLLFILLINIFHSFLPPLLLCLHPPPLPHLLLHSNFQQSHFIQLGHLSDVQSHFETMFAAENIGWRSIWSHWDAHSIRKIWDNFFRSTAHFIPR